MTRDYASLQRKPFLTPIWLTVLAAAAAMALLAFSAWMWATADSTTVIVIRHAEQETDAGSDPPLSAAGRARASRLGRLFGDFGSPGHLDAIYVAPTIRDRMTAVPLAGRLGLTPVDHVGGSAVLARRALHEHPGGRVLVIGHADTVKEIVEALSGATHLSSIAPDDYGTLYVVSVPRIGRANVLRMNY